jgi:hypothetical protein
MPAITRNMKRANQVVAQAPPSIINPESLSYFERYEDDMFNNIKSLVIGCEVAKGKTEKMIAAVKVYDLLNENLDNLLRYNPKKWIGFAATCYNKTSEFEIQRFKNLYSDVDKNLVEYHINTYMKTRKFIAAYLKNVRNTNPSLLNMHYENIVEAFKNIEDIETEDKMRREAKVFFRPRRNITVVNYTGMDTIDQDSEHDSDYFPEDDDEDEEDEEDHEELYDHEEEDKGLLDKKLQHVTFRQRRTAHRVDYTGMDMNEEDEGSVYLCETKWKDRVPTHRWVKYPASQANEMGDEDWCEEY